MALRTLASGTEGLEILQALVRPRVPLRGDLLARAWRRVVLRHDVLRTAFVLDDPRHPRQRVHPDLPCPWIEVDVTAVPRAAQARLVDDLVRAERRRGFALDRPPLWRLVAVREDGMPRAFLFSFHHAILDGWSLRLVLEDWMRQYAALRDDRRARCRPPQSFESFVRRWQGRDPTAARVFWRRHLAGVSEPTPVQGLRAGPVPVGCRGAEGGAYRERRLDLSATGTEHLREAARRAGVSVHTLVRSLWGVLLGASTGYDDVVLGEVRTLREPGRPGSSAAVGLLINAVPVRVAIEPEVPVGRWLRTRHDEWSSIRRHAWAPADRVREWAGLPPSQRLFETLLVYDRSPPDEPIATAVGTLDLRVVRRPGYPLVLAAWEGEALGLRIGFDERVEVVAAARLLHRLRWLLESVPAALDLPLGALSLLPRVERHQVLFEWAPGRPAGSGTIPDRFARRAAAAPDAVALVDGARTVSYGALQDRAARLAARLRARGVGAGSVVGIEATRSVETVAGLLAVLHAGGAYLPLDPEDPPARIREALDAAGAGHALVSTGSADLFAGRDIERLAPDPPAPRGAGARALASVAGPWDPAYVLFTSGSTGRPKPVAVAHTPVVQLVGDPTFARIGPDDTLLHAAPLAFDASTFEVWGSLLNGARTVLLRPGPPSLADWVETVERERVTVLWLTAGLFHAIPRSELRRMASLRHLLAGGDVLLVARCREVLEDLPRTGLVNGYGPTEATTFTCCHRVGPELAARSPSVPIGRPVDGMRVYVVDERMRPVPAGAPGELWIGGEGLASGYVGRPAETAAAFLPDPWAQAPGARLYRSGDRARFLPAGELEFLGRLDRQVKIRGFRVEPREVEDQLMRHPDVAVGAVVALADPSGSRRLVAYVVPRTGARAVSAGLRERLRVHLPPYMVPSAFVLLDALPITPSGKVDYSALPLPLPDRARTASRSATTLEARVIEAWRQVLEIDEIGPDDDFFALGGHSLLGMLLLIRLHEMLGVELTLSQIFETPTVAGMAELVARRPAAPRRARDGGIESGVL